MRSDWATENTTPSSSPSVMPQTSMFSYHSDMSSGRNAQRAWLWIVQPSYDPATSTAANRR